MKDFKKLAQEAVASSSVMANRTKISTDDVLNKVLTITDFDIVPGTKGPHAVVLFSEFSANYYNGGKALTAMCNKWVDAYDGDIDLCRAELSADGGVKVSLSRIITKDGNPFTTVTVI